jgi:hypothetical protein
MHAVGGWSPLRPLAASVPELSHHAVDSGGAREAHVLLRS